jgi:hypothetical protein
MAAIITTAMVKLMVSRLEMEGSLSDFENIGLFFMDGKISFFFMIEVRKTKGVHKDRVNPDI